MNYFHFLHFESYDGNHVSQLGVVNNLLSRISTFTTKSNTVSMNFINGKCSPSRTSSPNRRNSNFYCLYSSSPPLPPLARPPFLPVSLAILLPFSKEDDEALPALWCDFALYVASMPANQLIPFLRSVVVSILPCDGRRIT